jgi:uncharacterized membrane protein
VVFWKKKPILPPDVQEAVVASIRAAEQRTSGEIRVFMENRCSYMDAMDRALELFTALGMAQTEERNAVLVYMALKDHQFAIYGDESIYIKAGGPHFWERAAQMLQASLRSGDVAGGLVACITEIGNALATHYPYDAEVDKNELPDEIVFGK